MREDTPNPTETWGSREWGGLVEWGWDILLKMGAVYGMRNSLRVEQEQDKVWIVKQKLKNKLKKIYLKR